MSDDLRADLERENQTLWGTPKPDWGIWNTKRHARLWQAVALLCDLSPESLEFRHPPGTRDELLGRFTSKFANLLELAKSGIAAGSLKVLKLDLENTENSDIDMTTFVTWAHGKGYPIPPNYPLSARV